MNDISYPIAKSISTAKLVNANDVKSGLECDCICIECEESMIAVNKEGNKQRPHFRHHNETNCSGSFESYIHCLAKDLFLEIDEIVLPPIKLYDLNEIHRQKFKSDLKNIYDKYSIPEQLEESFFDWGEEFQEVRRLRLKNVTCELPIRNKKGELIRADIACEYNGEVFLIEPFYTSKIDCDKLAKIETLDKSVIEINLLKFLTERPPKKIIPLNTKNQFLFEIQELKDFLIDSVNSKKWVYVRNIKVNSIIENKLKEIESRLLNSSSGIEEIMAEKLNLEKINLEIEKVTKQLNNLQSKIRESNLKIERLTYKFKNSKRRQKAII